MTTRRARSCVFKRRPGHSLSVQPRDGVAVLGGWGGAAPPVALPRDDSGRRFALRDQLFGLCASRQLLHRVVLAHPLRVDDEEVLGGVVGRDEEAAVVAVGRGGSPVFVQRASFSSRNLLCCRRSW